ncbi:GMC oxidoreductase [Colletotrichum higginsianum IMI 349063]|uniref:GMC oxidoreductase n=2 Tax=Colletotrichum higginsianum (strain IMI 349063) TaxID=759273 RepID=A0A1B7XR46_COLHI|nr:GMC oxidoreductase [Colletotrichum higginsianum IMI 349063]OBR02230.1 GMC oxidoreductase [Colletotrichum higginsianum IMI 349063]
MRFAIFLSGSVLQSRLCYAAKVADEYSHLFGTPSQSETFDYLIVGGGNSGLVAAMRLSVEGNYSVAVVEAGGFYQDDAGNTTEFPAYNSQYMDEPGTIDWKLTTKPQAQLGGRSVAYAQGKTLGGSTARNAMVYQRGTASFYDLWATAVGDTSYDWNNILPFLKKSVSFTPADGELRGGPAGTSDMTAFDPEAGPLNVGYWNYFVPVSAAFAKGMETLGLVETPTGMNSGEVLGYAQFPAAIDSETQLRDSSQTSFLKAAANCAGERLRIYPNTLAKRIVFNAKKAASGVVVSSGGPEYVINVKREVVLAAGAFRTPQLLMASGVGPPGVLEENNVTTVSALSGVGQGIHHRLWNNPEYKALAEEEYRQSVSGPLTAFAVNYILFDRLPKDANISAGLRENLEQYPEDWPHVEYIWNAAGQATNTSGDYLALGTVLLTHASLGSVTINSSDTANPPVVDVRWLSNDTDRELAIEGVKRARALAASTGVIKTEIAPGPDVQSDEQIWEWIKANTVTAHHATGSCKMGRKDDASAVVDAKGCVLGGASSLRIIDASIIPIAFPGQPMATIYING